MRTTALVTIGLVLAFVCLRTMASDPVRSPETASVTLERRFRDTVRPFLETYCLGCHGKEKPKGDLDLSAYPTADAVAKDLAHWELVLEQLEEKSMPPAKAKRHPQAEAGRRSSSGSRRSARRKRSGTRAIPARCRCAG